jgi:hypothetical protein
MLNAKKKDKDKTDGGSGRFFLAPQPATTSDVLLAAFVAGGHVTTDEDGNLAPTESGQSLLSAINPAAQILVPDSLD